MKKNKIKIMKFSLGLLILPLKKIIINGSNIKV